MRIPAPAGFPGLEDLLGTTSDDSKARCASLLRALTDLYLQRPVHTLEDDHYYTELALRLIDAADVSDRAALGARLAACSSAPRPQAFGARCHRSRRSDSPAAPAAEDGRIRVAYRGRYSRSFTGHRERVSPYSASRAQLSSYASSRTIRAIGTVLSRNCAGTPADPDQSRIRTVHPDPIVSADRAHGYPASGSGRAPQA